jgi:catechol 2,3-dioxygenase-like lactoylglutathione lyase family enzyme
MRCLRLAHVNVRVQDLDAAVRFYTDVMGLEPIPRGDRGGKGAWFRLGSTEVHLAEDPSPQPPSKRHFAVEVADVEEARRDAEAKGAEIDKVEERRFFLRDPSGNRIEVAEQP